MGIDIDMVRDPGTGVTTVALTGELGFGTAAQVRTVLRKCASECPSAVLVDLNRLDSVNASMLSLFATASHHAMREWGVPLLLYGAREDVARGLAAFRTFSGIYEARGDALRALRTWAPRWLHERFLPVRASVPLARGLVGDACLAWNLVPLWHRARLIATELATNAIQHARTEFDVTVACTPLYLRIAVQDRYRALPTMHPVPLDQIGALEGHGRGLRLVSDTATNWGCTPLPDGKIVWALLRTDRPRVPATPHADEPRRPRRSRSRPG